MRLISISIISKSPSYTSYQPVLQVDEALRALLQALPTKADIEAPILQFEDAHCREIQVVQTEVQLPTDRMAAEESATTDPELLVAALERALESQADAVVAFQLHLEDLGGQEPPKYSVDPRPRRSHRS